MSTIPVQASVIDDVLAVREKDILDLIEDDLTEARRLGDYGTIRDATDDLEAILLHSRSPWIITRARKLFDEAFDPVV